MGTIPTPPTVVSGGLGTAASFNLMGQCVTFWSLTPRCYAYQGSTQSLTSGTTTVVSLDNEVYDVANNYDGGGDSPAHDNSTNNSRVFVRTTGKYEITGQVQIASNATGNRIAQIRLNAAGNPASGTLLTTNQQSPLTGASTSVSMVPIEAALTAGDYVEMFALQTSGGALNTVAGQGVTFLRIKLTGS